MSNVKISNLPPATNPVAASAVVPVVQNGVTQKAYVSALTGGQSVTPEQFGAAGDGNSDDTAFMQAAMNAAVAGGLTLQLRMGATYLLSSWTPYTPAGRLRILGGAISGASGNSTLRGPASQVVCLSPSTNIEIENVVFDRWTSAISRTVAQTGSFDYFNIRNCRFVNCTANVIIIQKPIENYHIENNDFESCTGTVGTFNAMGILIGDNVFANQDTWENGWIINNRFKSLSATGTRAVAAMLIYGRAVTIANNKIESLSQTGTAEAWGIYTKVRYSSIYGNYIDGVNAVGSADNQGINVKGNTRASPISPQGFSNSIWGNNIRNITNSISASGKGGGIRVQTDDAVVYGNLCEDCGIVCDEGSAYQNVTICDNILQNQSFIATTTGIRIEQQGSFVCADNNTIKNFTTGILIDGPPTGTMTDTQVTSNRIIGATYGIIWNATTGGTLTRTVIERNVVPTGTAGLLNNGGGGTLSNSRIRFNDFNGCTTPVSGSVGTNAVIVGNLASNLSAAQTTVVTDNYTQIDATSSFGFSVSSSAAQVRLTTLGGGSSYAIRVNGNAVDTINVNDLNVGLGTTTFGTNATRTLAIINGTEPSSGPADTLQIYSVDRSAGNTIPAIYCEGSGVTNAGITNTTVTNKIALKVNGTVYYLLATTNAT